MKLTKTTLKQIIKEELSKALNEELPKLSMKDRDAWIAKQREKRGMKPAATAIAPEEDSAPMSTADGRSDDANAMGQSMASNEDLMGLDDMTPDGARRAINAALKAGEIDKDEWRRLRRKYHKRKKWAGALSKDPRANAIDQAEKLYRKGKRAEAKKAAKWWLKRNPKVGGNYGRIARQIISAPD